MTAAGEAVHLACQGHWEARLLPYEGQTPQCVLSRATPRPARSLWVNSKEEAAYFVIIHSLLGTCFSQAEPTSEINNFSEETFFFQKNSNSDRIAYYGNIGPKPRITLLANHTAQLKVIQKKCEVTPAEKA